MAENKKRVVLGSGHLYLVEYNGTIPSNAELEQEENRLGFISGGATLTYTPTFYTVQDDLGYIKVSMITEEEVTFTSGILTWTGETLAKLSATSRVTFDDSTGVRTVKIGGVNNWSDTKYVIHFVSAGLGSPVRITIVGNNENGFELAFAKDNESIVNAEFKAQPNLDNEGTLVIYEEDTSITTTYTAVEPAGTENPYEEGWYTQPEVGVYVLTDDTTVDSLKTYYEKTVG